jgi:DNA-binding IclR family transcriptional regulator
MLTEIAAAISLTPSTTSRLLATLIKRSYILRNEETRKYELGPQAMHLISATFQPFDIRPLAAPYLRKLHEMFNESVSLYIAIENERICLDRIETTHPLRRIIQIGDRLPLSRGAGGKALLAWLPQEEQKRALSNDKALTKESLDTVRKQGYAVSEGERELGVGAVAAPVFGHNGKIVAAISIAAPTVRLSREVIDTMLPVLCEATRELSLKLGYVRE